MKVAIASGKGGTGKTFVSTNLFHTFRSMGISVSLADCDAEVPNSLAFLSATEHKKKDVTQYLPVIDASKCAFCGKCADYCAYNAIFIAPQMQKIRLLDDMCHGCGACEVACPNYVIRESYKKIGTVTVYKIDGKKCFVYLPAKVSKKRYIYFYGPRRPSCKPIQTDSLERPTGAF